MHLLLSRSLRPSSGVGEDAPAAHRRPLAAPRLPRLPPLPRASQLARRATGQEDGGKEGRRSIHNPELDEDVVFDSPEPADPEEEGLVDYFNDMPINDAGVEDRAVLSIDDMAQLKKEGLDMGLDKLKAYGPEAVFVAGFRAEEFPLLQAVLDADETMRGQSIRLILVTNELLVKPVHLALQTPPLPMNAIYSAAARGSSWGSERVLLFSGLSMKDQGTVLELVDELGFPKVTPGQIDEENCTMRVGDVLAEAVQEYRKALSRRKAGDAPIWEREAAELEAQAAKSSSQAGEGGGDWMNEMPKGYDLRSDDPTNLGNALNTDGTVDSEFVESLMGGVKEQVLRSLKEQNLDLEALGEDVEMNNGGSPVKMEDHQENTGSAREGDEAVDSPVDRSAESTAAAQEKACNQQEPPSNGTSAPAVEESKQATLRQVEAAFELALRGGVTSVELEALIDDVYGAEPGPGTERPKELARSSAAPASPTRPGANFVSKSDFRQMLNNGPADYSGVEDENAMTKAQLRDSAERHNLDFDTLLKDAESKGIKIKD